MSTEPVKLTREILDRLKELEAKATPAPWEEVTEQAGECPSFGSDTFVDSFTGHVFDCSKQDDARLACALRNHAPALIAAAEELEQIGSALAQIESRAGEPAAHNASIHQRFLNYAQVMDAVGLTLAGYAIDENTLRAENDQLKTRVESLKVLLVKISDLGAGHAYNCGINAPGQYCTCGLESTLAEIKSEIDRE